VVLAYTDGVIEAPNRDGEEWGIEGLLNAVAECDTRSTEDVIRAVFASMDQFTQGLQTDDATVVALQID
jgi:sigma-B regulation protein RsbU (phosphoserine phosphatase)